jgi:carbon monoxide dehydrogenase subunit G
MEHQVTVPFPVDDVRRTLADPVRLRRCVPGLQVSAGEESGSDDEVAGRLKLRIGGSTITYRGVLRLSAEDGGVRVEAEGREVRGEGGAKAALVIVAEEADGGTDLRITGTVDADGRLAEADDKTAESAARRLLDRFAAELSEELKRQRGAARQTGKPTAPAEEPASAEPETAAEEAVTEAPATQEAAAEEPTAEAPTAEKPVAAEPEAAGPAHEEPAHEEPTDEPAAGESAGPAEPRPAELPGREVPAEELLPGEPDSDALVNGRRTMIGRSAEEVDHAPPRGRYAPVPSPATVRGRITSLRWAGPAAAVVASAVVVGRLLRRRR